MADQVQLTVNGAPITVPEGTLLAVALARAGVPRFRRSVRGESRAAVCGMGVCFECRVTINGQPHQRSCMTLCAPGMEVKTDE